MNDRKIILVEGEKLNNVIIAKGALKLPDSPIEVHWYGDKSDVVGYADNFERDSDTGEITCELTTINSGMVKVSELDAALYFTDVKVQKDSDIQTVIHGIVRAVSLLPASPAIRGLQ